MTKIKTDDVGGQSRVDKVRPSQPPKGLGSYRGKEGRSESQRWIWVSCFFHRSSQLFGVLGCRQRGRVIDECHFLVCHSSVVASVFAPSARVITVKPFQPMANLRCPTAARPVLNVEHVDGPGDGDESRKKGSCSEDVLSNRLSSDAFASTHRQRHWSTSESDGVMGNSSAGSAGNGGNGGNA